MNRIELHIKVLSPLAVGRQKPGSSISEVEDYIPGTVIRGAIAAQILRESGQSTADLATQGEDFQALFLGEQPAIFQHGYPATFTTQRSTQIVPDTERVACIPATALTTKKDEGFKPEGAGVFDTLIDRFCAECYGYPYDPCTLKGERVDTFSGLYCQVNKRYYTLSNGKRLLTRVGINRRRATAEEDILYSIEVLNETKPTRDHPMVYQSAIWVNDEALAQTLQQYIRDRSTAFRLGGSTSRGLGAVEITAKPPVQVISHLQPRVKQFNAALKQRWQQWQVFRQPSTDAISDRTFFTLGLQADAILSEHWQRTTVISIAMLQQMTGIQDDSLQLHAAYSSYTHRSGWNAAWGLMKDVELVTNKGSTYLFSTANPDTWWTVLARLELEGVGDRTCEGFGQIRVCDEFHTIFRENAK